MAGFYVESRQELLSLLSTLLVEGEKIGCGDSVTLRKPGYSNISETEAILL